jgi:hypothetical protein
MRRCAAAATGAHFSSIAIEAPIFDNTRQNQDSQDNKSNQSQARQPTPYRDPACLAIAQAMAGANAVLRASLRLGNRRSRAHGFLFFHTYWAPMRNR